MADCFARDFRAAAVDSASLGKSGLLKVALMILFGAVKNSGGGYFGDDWTAKATGLLKLLPGCFGTRALFVAVEKNRGTILRSDVDPLPIERGRVVDLPEYTQQIIIGDSICIVPNVHHFGVSRAVGTNHTVGRVYNGSAAVADRHVQYSFHLAKRFLDAPEASRTKHRLLNYHLLTAAPLRPGSSVSLIVRYSFGPQAL